MTTAAAIDRIHAALAGHVAADRLPGAVALVARGDDVRVTVLGARSVGGAAMTRDTVFRIASMSKPIAAVAALALVDDGTLALDASIERWLPELADRRVLVRPDGPLDQTVPARRAITVRDLLAFRMGFGIQWAGQGAPVVRAANALQLGAFGPPHPQEPPALDEWLRRFATLPLMDQPGTRWRYHTGSEVLGALLARAAGADLGEVIRARVLAPLGMRDTAFWARDDARDRLATCYGSLDGDAQAVYDPVDGAWARPPAFPSAGGGLVSTLDDLLAFARMLIGHGPQLVPARAIAEMTRDQLAAAEKQDGSLAPGLFATRGWGFGVAVNTAVDAYGWPVGTYGWDGGLGTSWRTDPASGSIAIVLTQVSAYPDFWPVYRDVWTAAAEVTRG